MDDEIIYSWCFNDVKFFDSTHSTVIIILDKDLKSFLSLRSQHNYPSNSSDVAIWGVSNLTTRIRRI